MVALSRPAVLGLALLAVALPSAQAQAEAASGDAQRGRGLFESRCGGCHSLDQNRVGPALGNVVGRAAGKKADFAYSAALAAASHLWTPDKLQAWLTDPEALVPGQAMGYRLSSATDRRDVVAYLQTLAAGQPAR